MSFLITLEQDLTYVWLRMIFTRTDQKSGEIGLERLEDKARSVAKLQLAIIGNFNATFDSATQSGSSCDLHFIRGGQSGPCMISTDFTPCLSFIISDANHSQRITPSMWSMGLV